MLKISLLTLLTQSLKYLAGTTDFIPGEGGGGQGGGGGGSHKSDVVIIANFYRNSETQMKLGF